MKRFRKTILALVLSTAFCLGGCSSHDCAYCGQKATWKAQETFLGEPIGDPVYVCSDCKRLGYGPHSTLTGNRITWTKL